MIKKEAKRRNLFLISVVFCFISIFIYEILTPMMMDDMSYLSQVKEANSFFDLFGQEKVQYLNWTGRSVAHMMMRILMFIDLQIPVGGRMLFNFVAAAAFTAVTLLVYRNIQKKQNYDVMTYVLIVLIIWGYGVSFAQTVLWETGACNYLLTTMIILGFMTSFRIGVEKCIISDTNDGASGKIKAVWMLALGILAGWCNENTSGGCLLFVLMLFVLFIRTGRKPRIWMITGLAGNAIGLMIMVFAPGNAIRSSYRTELHSGIVGMAARFVNLTLAVRDEFFVLICVLIVLVVLLRLQGKKWTELFDVLVFAGLFFITCYSLVLTATPQNRALFGAEFFLILAIVQAFVDVTEEARWVQLIKKSIVYIMLLYMFFTYIDCGASLARIYREENERYDYLEELSKEGVSDATAPMLRPQFVNKYTAAYDCDITEDHTTWTNEMMANFYGFATLSGVDRDEWTNY